VEWWSNEFNEGTIDLIFEEQSFYDGQGACWHFWGYYFSFLTNDAKGNRIRSGKTALKQLRRQRNVEAIATVHLVIWYAGRIRVPSDGNHNTREEAIVLNLFFASASRGRLHLCGALAMAVAISSLVPGH